MYTLVQAAKALGNKPKYEKIISDMAEWIEGTAERAVTNIMRHRKADRKAKSRRRRQGDQLQRAARGYTL